ncbi:hypothetical protein BTZ20_4360 [Rhodococcus sp. MTM3W5.2]|nr:hypothetical protein BTZ20_4360 [Rhodococcus sp. MTM3W5.2]
MEQIREIFDESARYGPNLGAAAYDQTISLEHLSEADVSGLGIDLGTTNTVVGTPKTASS